MPDITIPITARKVRKVIKDFLTYNAVKLRLEFQEEETDEFCYTFNLRDTRGLGKLGPFEVHDHNTETRLKLLKPMPPGENDIKAYLELYPPDPPMSSREWTQVWQETNDLIFQKREEKQEQVINALYAYLQNAGIRISSKTARTLNASQTGEIQVDREKLAKMLKLAFKKGELKDICFALRIDYEDFKGKKGEMIRELIGFVERHGHTKEFIEKCRETNPNPEYDWDACVKINE